MDTRLGLKTAPEADRCDLQPGRRGPQMRERCLDQMKRTVTQIKLQISLVLSLLETFGWRHLE